MLGILFWSLVPGWFLGFAAVGYFVKFSILAIKSIPQILGVLLGVILFPFFPFYGAYRKRKTDPEEAKRLFKVASILYSIAIVLGVSIWFITDTYYGLFLLYPVWTIWAFYYQRGRVYTAGEKTIIYFFFILIGIFISGLATYYLNNPYIVICTSLLLLPTVLPFYFIMLRRRNDPAESQHLMKFSILVFVVIYLLFAIAIVTGVNIALIVTILAILFPTLFLFFTGYYLRHKYPIITTILFCMVCAIAVVPLTIWAAQNNNIEIIILTTYLPLMAIYPICMIVYKKKKDPQEADKLTNFNIRMLLLICAFILSAYLICPKDALGASIFILFFAPLLFTGYYIRHKYPVIAKIIYCIYSIFVILAIFVIAVSAVVPT